MEMEGVLQAGDAKDWVYKGEGAANLILSYTGSSPAMVCTDLVPSVSSFAWCAVNFGALLLLHGCGYSSPDPVPDRASDYTGIRDHLVA